MYGFIVSERVCYVQKLNTCAMFSISADSKFVMIDVETDINMCFSNVVNATVSYEMQLCLCVNVGKCLCVYANGLLIKRGISIIHVVYTRPRVRFLMQRLLTCLAGRDWFRWCGRWRWRNKSRVIYSKYEPKTGNRYRYRYKSVYMLDFLRVML